MLKIAAPANVYAYVYRPVEIDPAATAIVEYRMKVGPSSGDSWAPSVFLYWAPTRYVAHGQLSDGVLRSNHFAIKLSGRWNLGLEPGAWVEMRIQLTPARIELYARPTDGEWRRVAHILRPADMMGSPVELMIGKGFENDTTSPNEKLQNSLATAPGDVGAAWFSYIRFTVDGQEVFFDDFDNLDAWQIRLDPTYETEVTIAVSEPPGDGIEVTASPLRPTDIRWETQIAAIERRYTNRDASADSIVFIGDSNINLWTDLADYFPGLPVINAGFGGSQIVDAVYYADRVVIPYRPHTVVLHVGVNDLTAQKPPLQVLEDFKAFVAKVHDALPETRILYLSIPPTERRRALQGGVDEANRLIREYTETDPLLEFIDVTAAMLGPNGRPNAGLFKDDGLHLNQAGYEVWAQHLLPYLTHR
ncbi:MAG: hypothetical protein GX161_06550 [Firmicutes bacterium]|nr:hypothetical protein [Bacillota bacterium]